MKNTQRTCGVGGLVVLIAAAVAWYRLAPGEPPVGQLPIVTIDAATLDTFKADFNRYANEPRVILLLSPT